MRQSTYVVLNDFNVAATRHEMLECLYWCNDSSFCLERSHKNFDYSLNPKVHCDNLYIIQVYALNR